MVGPVAFAPSRVRDLMKAKGFDLDDYLAKGFDRGWIHRKSRIAPPGRPHDAIRLALWLDVPVEYLFGVAPEYDSMDAWEVASRASLDTFFKRHTEGREAARYRDDFEQHIAAHGERAPRTVSAWAAWFDAFQRGRARERAEAQRLERCVPEDRERKG